MSFRIPASSSIAFLSSLGPIDHSPSSKSHTPSPLCVSSLCSSPLIWAGDTPGWNRDRWYRSRTSILAEGAWEAGVDWESESNRWRVLRSCVMGSEISRKWREERERTEEEAEEGEGEEGEGKKGRRGEEGHAQMNV